MKMKDASTILDHFKEYKAWAKNLTKQRIKILQTDSSYEYLNTDMQKYLKEHGIEHQHTVPYTPQQNEIAEHFNRTLVE